MKCPFCGKDCFDNRQTKTGRQPDFKCRDTKDCKSAGWVGKDGKTVTFQDPAKNKKVVPLDESTPTQTKDTKTTSVVSNSSSAVVKGNRKVDPSFFSAWAKDFAVAAIEKDVVKANTIDETWDIFMDFYNRFDKLLNGETTKSTPVSETKPVSTPVEKDEESISVDDLEDFDGLDLNFDM